MLPIEPYMKVHTYEGKTVTIDQLFEGFMP